MLLNAYAILDCCFERLIYSDSAISTFFKKHLLILLNNYFIL